MITIGGDQDPDRAIAITTGTGDGDRDRLRRRGVYVPGVGTMTREGLADRNPALLLVGDGNPGETHA